tara:strand:+ start:359 stop:886 length:528 start_codon:yes stop_codon:yes gene_type:complete
MTTLVRVLFDWSGTSNHSLTVQKGEWLVVYWNKSSHGWWYCEKEDLSAGFVPANYLEIQSPPPRGSSSAPGPSTTSPSSSSASSSSSSSSSSSNTAGQNLLLGFRQNKSRNLSEEQRHPESTLIEMATHSVQTIHHGSSGEGGHVNVHGVVVPGLPVPEEEPPTIRLVSLLSPAS